MTTARAGDGYLYKMHVQSRKPFLRYTLQTAPEGMTVANDGTVRWLVPPDTRKSNVEVSIRVAETNGKESAVQRFVIRVSE